MIKRSKSLKRSTKPLRKSGPTKAKKVARQRKHYASPEYKTARKDAMQRSGGRCEAIHVFLKCGLLSAQFLPGESIYELTEELSVSRCPVTEELEFHEEDYGSDLGIIRPIRGFMVCSGDHQYIEMTRYPHRHPRRRVA